MKKHVWRAVVDEFLPDVQGAVLLSVEESHFLSNVVRLDEDDMFEITDGQGNVARARAQGQSRRRIYAEILKLYPRIKLKNDVRLYLAEPERKALEEICTHASSVGFSQIVIFSGENTQSQQPVRVSRLKTLAKDSLRFSKNPWMPHVFHFGGTLKEGLLEGIDAQVLLLCDETESIKASLSSVSLSRTESVGLFVGPEAGWSEQERKLLLADKRMSPVSLGPWIQKVPKAALNAVSFLNIMLS